jgi:hypothetical protein
MSFTPHNEVCRARLEKALKARDSQRWKRANERREEVFWNKMREDEEKMAESEKRKMYHDEDQLAKGRRMIR